MPIKVVKSDNDLITSAQVCDLVEQQRFFHKDTLQQQESTYKTLPKCHRPLQENIRQVLKRAM